MFILEFPRSLVNEYLMALQKYAHSFSEIEFYKNRGV